MANFSESLTIRILGDSSQLQSELDAVMDRISELRTRLFGFNDVSQAIGSVVDRLGSSVRPLQNVSRLLSQITNKARLLGQIPITLNVAPAIGSLVSLGQMIDLVAAKLLSLSQIPVGGGPAGIPGGVAGPVRGCAPGGAVSGPGGIDRVPAMLTSGEFVIRRPVAQQLGTAFLNSLNQIVPARPAAAQSSNEPINSSGQTHVSNFGGITINVTQPSSINGILRDLSLQGFRLRNRRG